MDPRETSRSRVVHSPLVLAKVVKVLWLRRHSSIAMLSLSKIVSSCGPLKTRASPSDSKRSWADGPRLGHLRTLFATV